LKLADVFLDTYPYNCGSTSNDILNSQVALVSLCGKTLVSKMGYSLLMNRGLEWYVANDMQGYVELIIKISSNKSGKNNRNSSPGVGDKSFMINLHNNF
jgi:predicted O-linked N-acetylglucosamine transferase (SPINDLY family)